MKYRSNHFTTLFIILLSLFIGFGWLYPEDGGSASADRPNVVLINVDDLGYGNVGAVPEAFNNQPQKSQKE